MRWIAALLLLAAVPATARDALGIYGGWGAFRADAHMGTSPELDDAVLDAIMRKAGLAGG